MILIAFGVLWCWFRLLLEVIYFVKIRNRLSLFKVSNIILRVAYNTFFLNKYARISIKSELFLLFCCYGNDANVGICSL